MGNIYTHKAGGTSMATPDSIEKVAENVLNTTSESNGRIVLVVSAPGKVKDGEKVTNLLFQIVNLKFTLGNYEHLLQNVKDRFMSCANILGVYKKYFESILNKTLDEISTAESVDFILSRGEYLTAHLMQIYLHKVLQLEAEFFDAVDCINFTIIDSRETAICNQSFVSMVQNSEKRIFVIPGFYGSKEDGSIKTFPRGGSDISGAVIASALYSPVYYNWSDVDGFYTASPKLIPNSKVIFRLSYKHARILTVGGAEVLHPQVMKYLAENKITLNLRNTFNPYHPGTIVDVDDEIKKQNGLIGVSVEDELSILIITKLGAHEESGFGEKILSVLSKKNISYEYELPSGIDNSQFVIKSKSLPNDTNELLILLRDIVSADEVKIIHNFSVLSSATYNPSDVTDTMLVLERNNIEVYCYTYNKSSNQIQIVLEQKDALMALMFIHQRFFNA